VLGFSPSFRKKVVDRCVRLGSHQPPSQGLGLGDDFVDRSDADLAPGEIHHDVTVAIEADRLAKLCRNAVSSWACIGSFCRFRYRMVRRAEQEQTGVQLAAQPLD
jgi:hypothetical protein